MCYHTAVNSLAARLRNARLSLGLTGEQLAGAMMSVGEVNGLPRPAATRRRVSRCEGAGDSRRVSVAWLVYAYLALRAHGWDGSLDELLGL